jgi:hypothetical protein
MSPHCVERAATPTNPLSTIRQLSVRSTRGRDYDREANEVQW